jgi:branched-chain amino acid transport system permease protein
MSIVKSQMPGQRCPVQLARFIPYFGSGILLVALPPCLPPYYQILMTRALIFSIFAISLDVIYGYTGLFSLGHAAFFGAGGYTVGILMVRYGIDSFWIGAPLAILMASFVAAIFGVIALRVSGIYFLLVTFALGELLVSLATKWKFLSTTGSTEGVMNILQPSLNLPWFRWNITNFYYFVFLIFVLCFFFLHRLINSPFGRALQGIRESESRMRALGYNTWLYKYIAFIAAGLFAGVSGVLIAYHDGFMVPASFGVGTSTLAMFMVIIGGVGSLYGPALGSCILIFVNFLASTYTPERWPLILGVFFVVVIMYARGGVAVYMSKLWQKVLLSWKL